MWRSDAVFTTPLETHNAMAPHATIAPWSGGRLTLYDATQLIYGVKRFVARTLGIPDDRVRVVSKFVGGAFGSKGSAWSHVVLAAMTARHVGRPVNADLSEYLVPVNRDVGDIDVILVDEEDPYVDPIGVKGVGEIGTTGVAAAVANAVYHATGVRVRDLPITLDKVFPYLV